MWVRFRSEKSYAVKIYCGAVNACSGEPAVETAATKLRRQTRISRRESIQDYVILPDQKWLDGIATNEGRVRQFVVMPIGSGYSVEAQVTGEDVTGGLQFEITPATEEIEPLTFNYLGSSNPGKPLRGPNLSILTTGKSSSLSVQTDKMTVYVVSLTGREVLVEVDATDSVLDLKDKICEKAGMQPDHQRLIFAGKQLEGSY